MRRFYTKNILWYKYTYVRNKHAEKEKFKKKSGKWR